MDEAETEEAGRWPARGLLLLLLGALDGFVFHQLIEGTERWLWTDDPMKLGGAGFVASAGIVFALALERRRWLWSAAFALVVGLVVGSVTWRNGSWSWWGTNERWQLFSALLAVVIAVPLFQVSRDAGRARLDYQALHIHSWTNAILWGAAWGFVLIVFLLAQLLAQLFNLIGLHLLKDLLDKPWFVWTLVGGAFGAGIGLLRDRDRMLVMLQRVATAILSVLAPILALGLVLFVAALPFTGLATLWTTKQTTPILLFCVLSAFVLVNATIGNAADEEARAPAARYAALALGTVMLPLAVVAAISTGKRVEQYGLTPDQLWAITFVAIALACSLAYLLTILRRRLGWAEGVRRANIGVALGVCAITLFLALPVVSFGALSTQSQLGRLESGQVKPDQFDWAALRFDFGPAGVAALRRLQHSRVAVVSIGAGKALAMDNRFARYLVEAPSAAPLLKTVPAGIAVPADLRSAIMTTSQDICSGAGDCLLYWKPGESTAIVPMDHCAERLVGRDAQTRPGVHCSIDPHVLQLGKDSWHDVNDHRAASVAAPLSPSKERAMLEQERAAINRGDLQIHAVSRRQLFIGGRPSGSPFE